MATVTYAENEGGNNRSTAEDRPLLRSFPRPSGYGTHLHLPKKDNEDSMLSTIKEYLTADVSTRWADLILIVCFFMSGLIDAGAYNAYECFTSMQTGNTVFAALGVSNLPVSAPRLAWVKSVCAVLSFLLGAFVTGHFHRVAGQRKRWVLFSSFLVQAIFVAISAALVKLGRSSGSPVGGKQVFTVTAGLPEDPGFPWTDLIPIFLLSFSAAGKVVASRVLECNSLPAVVLTTLFCDLISDPGLFTAGLFSNVQRNRRAGGAVFYFAGAVIGGAAAAGNLGFSGALAIAAVTHAGVAGAFMAWREDREKGDEEGD